MKNVLPMLFVVIAACAGLNAQQQGTRPIELEDTVKWRTISGTRLSPEGKFIAWIEKTDDGLESTLFLVSTAKGAKVHSYEGADLPTFVPGDKVAVTWQHPTRAAKKAAKKAKKPEPKKTLAIITLKNGTVESVSKVRKFAVPHDEGRYIAILMEGKGSKGTPKADAKKPKKSLRRRRREKKQPVPQDSKTAGEKKKPISGHLLILRNLAKGKVSEHTDVVSFHFSRDGRALVLFKGHDGDVEWLDPRNGRAKTVVKAAGESRSPKLDRSGKRLLFLAKVGEAHEVVVYQKGKGTARFGTAGTPPVAEGWEVSTDRAPKFSRDGKRVFFGIRKETPKPPEKKDEAEKAKPKPVKLDIWSWTDDYIQPRQLKSAAREKKRSRLVVAHLSGTTPRLVALESERLRDVRMNFGDNGDYALGTDDQKYRRQASYDTNHPKDVWLINVKTGERQLVLNGLRGRPMLTPGGNWVYWWDGGQKTWRARSTLSDTVIDLGAGIEESLHAANHDSPSLPRPASRTLYWTRNDQTVIIGARNDLYSVPLASPDRATSITQRAGRDGKIRFALIDQDAEEAVVKTTAPLLLSAFHETSKDSGIWKASADGSLGPEPLQRIRARLGRPLFARKGRVTALTVETFDSPPDLHITTRTFGKLRRVSNLAKQLLPYAWGSTRLVHWKNANGGEMQGLLYLPPRFDPSTKYPMLVNFYERSSDRLHSFQTPAPHRSSVRMSYYASQGYVGFVPDVEYTIGSPGQSAVDCVIPGIESILAKGFVDPKRIGMQGHSWGGYQAAFLITRTNLFAAVIAGAPVANMTSAYGGIRWGSGMSRQFQYEKTQSRIGKTLWEAQDRYIANSPLFFLESVETPLLILHNDEDGAVPWYQGIELFMGLRRLHKPVWMLNYNGQPHWVTTPENRLDYAKRMKQFLDHHCRGAAAPRWMTKGVPAVRKGKDFGLQLESNDG